MQTPNNRPQQKEKLARTMRIDIAPEVADGDLQKGKDPSRILTRKARPPQTISQIGQAAAAQGSMS